MQTRVMVLMFCPSYYCALHLYEISRKYLNDFQDTERTLVYGGNGHFQYSKGNFSKSRKTRVMVHVFCTLSHGV